MTYGAVSITLQGIAADINARLKDAAGKEISFVLIVESDHVTQYVSNTKREDGVMLIESLLQQWKGGRADIPAHYNPDLTRRSRDLGQA